MSRWAKAVGRWSRPWSTTGTSILVTTLLVVLASGCGAGASAAKNGASTPATTSGSTALAASSSTGSDTTPLRMVVLGDSWVAGEHCGCTTFAGLWADDIPKQTGRPVEVTSLAGANERSSVQEKTTGSLLWTLRHDAQTRQIVASSDIVVVSTGGNDLPRIGDQIINSTCGGPDDTNCIYQLGHLWHRNFAHIAKTIVQLRDSKPTAIRFVTGGNFFLGDPDLNSLVPPDFALTGGALLTQLYVDANCDAARKYHAKCIDGRPILTGPNMDQRYDENAPSTFRKLADALDAEGLPELMLNTSRS